MKSAGSSWCTAFFAYQSLWKALDWVYPPQCAGCGKNGFSWCPDCQSFIDKITIPICQVCGLPHSTGGICKKCKTTPPPFEALRAYSEYTEPIRSAIIRMKDHSDFGLGLELSYSLVDLFRELNWQIDCVTPVPISYQHFRKRGYNQTDLFAYPFSLAIQAPYRPRLLSRCRETQSQVGLTAAERAQNVAAAFIADGKFIRSKNILIIDDVTTTGSSIAACATALLHSGAKKVYGLTLARPFLSDPQRIPMGV